MDITRRWFERGGRGGKGRKGKGVRVASKQGLEKAGTAQMTLPLRGNAHPGVRTTILLSRTTLPRTRDSKVKFPCISGIVLFLFPKLEKHAQQCSLPCPLTPLPTTASGHPEMSGWQNTTGGTATQEDVTTADSLSRLSRGTGCAHGLCSSVFCLTFGQLPTHQQRPPISTHLL